MFVTILGRTEGVNPKNFPNISFTDITGPKWEWAAPYIQWAAEAGIVNGVGDGLFAPDNIITREQYCTILIRFMDYAGLNFPGSPTLPAPAFYDQYNIQRYALPSVIRLAGYGLIDSYGGYIYPDGEMTRGSIANLFSQVHQMRTSGVLPDPSGFSRINPYVDYNDIADFLVETSIFTWDWFYGGFYLDETDTIDLYDPDLDCDVTYARVVHPALEHPVDMGELGGTHYTDEAWLALSQQLQWHITDDGLYLPAGIKASPDDGMTSCALDIHPIDETTFTVTLILYAGDEELRRVETYCVYEDGYWVFADPIPSYLDVVPVAFG